MNPTQIEEYQKFAREKLGFEFQDIDLLITALTHRSYVNEHKASAKAHNERLEFLGDAVLELVSSDFLYRNYDEPEGIMTAWRSALVRTESIGAAGEDLGYEPLVRLSKGEKHGSSRAHAVILADCFEAVIGAIYLDQGYDTAREFIAKHILVKLDQILRDGSWRDPKSYLQELAQHYDGATPQYKVLGEEGPDHDKTFMVGVYVGKQLKGKGSGHSKQEAEGNAAAEGVKGYLKTQAKSKN
jgi:ribonuclease-3